jgi:hypothetical protein
MRRIATPTSSAPRRECKRPLRGRLKPDEDPQRIAGRLKNAALDGAQSDFNRRLNYQPLGIA